DMKQDADVLVLDPLLSKLDSDPREGDFSARLKRALEGPASKLELVNLARRLDDAYRSGAAAAAIEGRRRGAQALRGLAQGKIDADALIKEAQALGKYHFYGPGFRMMTAGIRNVANAAGRKETAEHAREMARRLADGVPENTDVVAVGNVALFVQVPKS